ncbi:BLUF domain-containing protein [Fulvivirga sp. 2943]|uniref:BLUF domain-containing protein n=1 Tax=Fulvivirga sediminis TaxID=2803949 RepID=A0A937K013_9BACT|nr:BLUF domain-containing protein [Fulvivirga sediminis]
MFGFLEFKKGIFLQYLEGPENAERTLMKIIKSDNHHGVKRIIYLPLLADRFFCDWHMMLITQQRFVYFGLTDLL